MAVNMYCLKCGTYVSDELNFCPRCGESLAAAKRVTGQSSSTNQSGMQNQAYTPYATQDAAAYSQAPGTNTQAPTTAMKPVNPAQAAMNSEGSDGPSENPKKMAAIIVAAVAIVLVVLAVILFFVLGSHNKQDSYVSVSSASSVSQDGQSATSDSSSSTTSTSSSGSPSSSEAEYPPSFDTPSVSSTLTGQSESFDAANLVDENTVTAWAEGDSGDGSESWVEFTAEDTQLVSEIDIMGGCCESEILYYQNCRPEEITIATEQGSVTTRLEDEPFAWQRITLETPVETKTVRITINSTYPGSVTNDCCISEIAIQ